MVGEPSYFNRENDLLKDLHLGSEIAFTAIYNQFIYSLLDFSRGLLDSRQDAEDICADVFTNFWLMKERFHDIKNIKAFLFISVRNACLNFLKSSSVKMARNKTQIEQIDHVASFEDFSDVKSEYKERLRREVDRLPDQCRRIFKLACYEEKDNKEIADLLQISLKTVSNQKTRALQLLRIGQNLPAGTASIPFILYLLSF